MGDVDKTVKPARKLHRETHKKRTLTKTLEETTSASSSLLLVSGDARNESRLFQIMCKRSSKFELVDV